ncbi:MAG: ATP-dependent helicase [bacterium]|nr:ATP-dependent helicase [bacterium]
MPEFILQGAVSLPQKQIDYSKELNQEQLDVVLHGEGPSLVLAGAGSGKTRTLVYRVAYLIEHGIDPSRILLLTFTNKAASEMLTRVQELTGSDAKGIWSGTFHSVANRMLRMHLSAIGAPSFTILDQEDSRTLVKSVMKELKIDPKARRFPSPNVVQGLLSYQRNTLSSIQEAIEMRAANFEDCSSDIEEIGRIYDRRKQDARCMDFDDLLRAWSDLLDSEQGKSITQRFQYLLVDEYQDTNALQASIVSRLGKAHSNVLVVGDDAQSIYAFRGADVKNILQFPKEWPDAKVFKLVTNYRSTQDILDVANTSLSHNTKQFKKDLLGVRDREVKPCIVPATTTRQEAQYIAEQILEYRSKGVALQNMAVLFRSAAHSQALEFELMKRDIPYEVRGGFKFFARAHIKDILSYLRVIENVRDESAWLRILQMESGIGSQGATTIVRMITVYDELDRVLNDENAVSVSSRSSMGWGACRGVLRHVSQGNPRPSEMISRIIETGYSDTLEREYPDWKDRLQDLEALEQFSDSYDDLTSFLADISLYDSVTAVRERGAPPQDELLILSTIHQAKGLEWDTVFIIRANDDAFPSKYAVEEHEIEEERRLFYVAVTRAKRRLFITYPLTGGFDAMTFCRPSMFLEELPRHLFETMELREAKSTLNRWQNEDRGEEVIQLDKYGERLRRIEPASSKRVSGTATVWKKR